MHNDFDIVVVGFGPTGAVCTGLLGKLGLRTLVIDKAHDVYDKPRAFAVDHEIMRVFQNLRLADKIAPYTAPFTPSEYYGVDGQLIKRLGSVPPPYPLGWPPNMVFTQPPVEALLREGAAEHRSVKVALGTELVDLQQTDDQVTLQLRDDAGASRTVTGRYVIGCDGAWSTVRTLVDMALEDLEFDEPWLVVDVQVNERGAAKLPKVSIQYCNPSRPATYLIGPGNHRRWEIMVLPGEDRRELEDESEVWRLLSRWITPDDGKLWRKASYQFHALVAREWRRGRVFIAGDAAHQQPPFTGQGMCQGVRDVSNLSWKLHMVMTGKASDSLLDSYGMERSRHVKRLTTIIKGIGKLICERDPDAARARDARLLAEAGGEVRTVPRQELIPPLDTGFLSPVSHPANGTMFPQPRVWQGRDIVRLDSVAGDGFRVVANTVVPLERLQSNDAIKRLGARMVQISPEGSAPTAAQSTNGILSVMEADDVVTRWLDHYRCAAAIVRPDHYVYGVAENVKALEGQLANMAAALST
jgi:3-(3-hydroxy-phenyl)propionate hydroxylase